MYIFTLKINKIIPISYFVHSIEVLTAFVKLNLPPTVPNTYFIIFKLYAKLWLQDCENIRVVTKRQLLLNNLGPIFV